jgi:hypothetical protein
MGQERLPDLVADRATKVNPGPHQDLVRSGEFPEKRKGTAKQGIGADRRKHSIASCHDDMDRFSPQYQV